MAGEISKENGEYGEKIVEKFLKLIGWNFSEHPVVVPCHRTDLHKTPKGKDKKDHGLDFLYRYNCPLYTDTQKTVSISVKYRDKYKVSDVHKFINELGNTMHCLTLDSEIGRHKIYKSLTHIDYWGVLFYLAYEEDKDESILPKIDHNNTRNTSPIDFKPILLVDNSSLNFIYSSIVDVQKYYKDGIPKYSYMNTEQNIDSDKTPLAGEQLPLELLTSGILPYQVTKNEGKELYLYVKSSFSEENFASLFSFACKYTNGWPTHIKIKFFDYNEREHKNIVAQVLNDNQTEPLAKNTSVEKVTKLNFRDLEND